jgi:hypothetical protein
MKKVNKDNASRLAELKNPPYLKVGIYSLLVNVRTSSYAFASLPQLYHVAGKAKVKVNFKS